MLANRWKKLAPERQAAYGVGLIVACIAGVLMLLPGNESWHAAGPQNTGHTRIECSECHVRAPGNFVGQAFQNLTHAAGLADSATSFVFQPVGNDQCLRCHLNPDDRHPLVDFLEPEFEPARQAMGVQFCVSCHQEHLGVRVSVTPLVCQYCHQDIVPMELEDDPVDVPHTSLYRDLRWETCLGCHDFHGNHDREVPVQLSQRLTAEQIRQYLDGGDSPYGHRRLTVIQTMQQNGDL